MPSLKRKRLYAVIFRARHGGESFLKVGISSYEIERRFAADLPNFTIETVFRTWAYWSRDAMIVESNIHDMMGRWRYSPKMRLKSGNTECFVNCAQALERLKFICSGKPSVPVTPLHEKDLPPKMTKAEKRKRRKQRHLLALQAVGRWPSETQKFRVRQLKNGQPIEDYVGTQTWGHGFGKAFG